MIYPIPEETLQQHVALTQRAGYVFREHDTHLTFTGEDRSTFLNSFCTNDLKRLAIGCGCEAFFLNAKGKVLGHGFFFAGDGLISFDTVPGQAETLIPHLDRYVIREDVTISDRSSELVLCWVIGPEAASCLERLLACEPPAQALQQTVCKWENTDVCARRLPWFVLPCFQLIVERDFQPLLSQAMLAAGIEGCEHGAWEILRVENGWPLFGQDITAENLPQEINRDASAISFSKGCYLGQETVARIDALGHVNRLLVNIRIEGDMVPLVGQEVTVSGNVVGHITSAVWSVRLEQPLALAYLRSGHAAVGTALTIGDSTATVVNLPLE